MRDPYSELASMFLTSGDSTANATVPAAGTINPAPTTAAQSSAAKVDSSAKATVELLIVGNLPVRGNLWLPPYVDALAQQHGSAALIRLDGPEPSMQLLRAPTQAATHRAGGAMIDAMMDLGGFIDQWIVRLPAGVPVETLSGIAQRFDRITILTSADEAAVVAAYQTVKQLAIAAESTPLPPVGLAVVATDNRIAEDLVERLNRTTISFLGIELQLALCLPRIDAGLKSTRYISFAGQQELLLHEALDGIDNARHNRDGIILDEATDVAGRLYIDREEATMHRAETVLREVGSAKSAAAPTPAIAATPARTVASASAQFATPKQKTAASVHAPAAAAPPVTSSVRADVPRPPVIKLAPKPAMLMEAKHPARPSEPDDHGRPQSLAQYISGLTLLPIRSPGHEKVEIAVDREGRLHLLGHEHSLRELPVVERWTIAHRELIVLACPQKPIDSLALPRCHVFADRPIALADLHGSDYSLHVLAPVQVNGQTAWYSAPLNATV